MPIKPVDVTLQRFGKLIAIECVGYRPGGRLWRCQCDCGKESVVRVDRLRSGTTRSCGCGMVPKRAPGAAALHSLYAGYRRNARVRGKSFNLTEEEFHVITALNCYYCGAPPSMRTKKNGYNGDYIYNGVDRADNTIGYCVSNARPCCKRCNYLKSNLTESDFFDLVKHYSRIARHMGLM